jgi:hypothetical protein
VGKRCIEIVGLSYTFLTIPTRSGAVSTMWGKAHTMLSTAHSGTGAIAVRMNARIRWTVCKAMINHSFNACILGFGGVEGSLRYACSAATLAFCASGKSSHEGSRRLYRACVLARPSHWLLCTHQYGTPLRAAVERQQSYQVRHLSRSSSSRGVTWAERTASSTANVLYT